VSLATVQGYSKWDGAAQAPQTVLAEAVLKHQDAGDFDLPDVVLAKAKTASASRWVDRDLGDVPIAFLADGDTTGGNSGSPVIDGKGRLIGFNFDRVWETVAGDYVWRPEQSRNVISDIRFLYWMLEETVGATHLLEELGVVDFQGPPAAAQPAAAESKPPAAAPEPKWVATDGGAPAPGCACGVDDPRAPGWTALGLLGLLGLVRLRRRS
jgi:MYXO-CTERM domain-containing protein